MTTQHIQVPTCIADVPAPLPGYSPRRMLAEIADLWRDFAKVAFSTYHPEQHYMRGPGPACAAKPAAAK